MKRLLLILTLVCLLFTLTSCELFYGETKRDIYLLSVGLSYDIEDDKNSQQNTSPNQNEENLLNPLAGTLPDQKGIREELKVLTEKDGSTFHEIALIEDNKTITFETNMSFTLPSSDEKEMKKNIVSAITYMSEKVKENDIFIFYYAGHGNKNGALLFYVTKNKNTNEGTRSISSTIKEEWQFPPNQLISLISNNIKGNKLLILDSCYSGNFIEDEVKESSFASAYRDIMKSYEKRSKNLWIMAAAQKYQKSWEENKHGLFTAALLNSLGYDTTTNTPSSAYTGVVSFLELSKDILIKLGGHLDYGNYIFTQYPLYTSTHKDLVLFDLNIY